MSEKNKRKIEAHVKHSKKLYVKKTNIKIMNT